MLCCWSLKRELPFCPVVKSHISDALCGKRWDIRGSIRPGHSSTDLHFTLSLLSEKITRTAVDLISKIRYVLSPRMLILMGLLL